MPLDSPLAAIWAMSRGGLPVQREPVGPTAPPGLPPPFTPAGLLPAPPATTRFFAVEPTPTDWLSRTHEVQPGELPLEMPREPGLFRDLPPASAPTPTVGFTTESGQTTLPFAVQEL
ncbi:MAG: hypothetical protein N3D71_14640, partial [Burkholderiaceae bacterium]|nr:hypothetical protein [Burkholderiaceae bacterium]